MPMKSSGTPSSWREISKWDGATSWIAFPDEKMQRASHALVDGDDVWLVDPIDVDGLNDTLADLGTVRGVVILLDRHKRDSAVLARRHEVPVYLPEWMASVRSDINAPVEMIRRGLPDSSYDLHKLVDNPVWTEGFLFDEDSKTLVVAEALGTANFFLAGDERVGVHPGLRLKPPKTLERFAPERVLVGHGPGVFDRAAPALRDALDGSLRRTPRLYAETAKDLVL
jgi:hypothetical protein